MSSTLFLGIGNSLLSDEGVGVHVVTYLSEHHAGETGAIYLDGGTLSFTLAGDIASHDNLIVIDAARLNEKPGMIRTLVDDEMDKYLLGGHGSVHEVGLTDLLDIARLTNCHPQRRALIGIQPASIDWGERPSLSVAAAIPDAATAALRLHRGWIALSSD